MIPRNTLQSRVTDRNGDCYDHVSAKTKNKTELPLVIMTSEVGIAVVVIVECFINFRDILC